MRYKPILYFYTYLSLTLVISFWGPASYVDYDKPAVFAFMCAFFVVFGLGYYFGSRFRIPEANGKRVSIMPLLRLSIVIAVAGVSIEVVEALIRNPGAFSLENIGNNYFDIREFLAVSSSYPMGILIRFFTGFFRNIVMTIGLFHFRILPRWYKAGVILFYLLTFAVNSVLYGTQKMLGDMVIFGAVVGLVKMAEFTPRKRRRTLVTFAILGVLFVSYVVINQVQRYESIDVNVFNYGYRTVNRIFFNPDHLLFRIFGYRFGFGLGLLLTGYMTSGYYGLSLCLKLPFVWTYGVGSSYILSLALEKFLGFPNMYYSTYLHRMETTFGRLGADAWNSVFPWLASDFTFFGALAIFIPVGYVFAMAWRETIRYKNPVSLLMFATITLGLVFVPANNQLFNGIDGFIATWATVFYWAVYHRRYNIN